MYKILDWYYILLECILSWVWRKSIKSSRINGIVLMYHHISDKNVDIPDTCQHTKMEFINSIAKIKKQGYDFVSIKDALNIIREKRSRKFAVVTFDDVPLSVYDNAIPFLESQKVPYTLFITTSCVGKESFLSREHILNLKSSPYCTFGAHTVTHPNLRHCTDSLYEICESKRFLEDLLGQSIEYFAYPYGKPGSVSYRNMKLVRQAGYKCALGTIETAISDMSSKCMYYLPRIIVK